LGKNEDLLSYFDEEIGGVIGFFTDLPTAKYQQRANVETISSLFRKFNLEKIRLNIKFISLETSFTEADEDAAWELYVEMLTRIVTQPLPTSHGDEKTALDSVYSLFPITRGILRQHGRKTIRFTKVAVPVLNQVVRPFTAKWHGESLAGAFEDEAKRKEFRSELEELQKDLRNYNRLLARIASVEDLTELEDS